MIPFLVFFLGAFANAAVVATRVWSKDQPLTWPKWYKQKLHPIKTLAILAVTLFITSHYFFTMTVEYSLLTATMMTCVIGAMVFMKYLVPPVTIEKMILYFFVAIFLTAQWSAQSHEIGIAQEMLFFFYLLFTIQIVCAVILLPLLIKGKALKGGLIVILYLVSSILIVGSLFDPFYIAYLYCDYKPCPALSFDTDTLAKMFVAGFIFFTLVVNCTHILQLSPITKRGQKFSKRLLEIRAHTELLASKYVARKPADSSHSIRTYLIISVLLGILILNSYLQYINTPLLVTIVLIIGDILTDSPKKLPKIR